MLGMVSAQVAGGGRHSSLVCDCAGMQARKGGSRAAAGHQGIRAAQHSQNERMPRQPQHGSSNTKNPSTLVLI